MTPTRSSNMPKNNKKSNNKAKNAARQAKREKDYSVESCPHHIIFISNAVAEQLRREGTARMERRNTGGVMEHRFTMTPMKKKCYTVVK